jgi:hypothetical protein
MPESDFPTERERFTVLYLTTLQCSDNLDCGERATFAHEAPAVPIDQSPPWPDVERCPHCGEKFPEDLGAATVEVRQAETYPPEEVGR